MDLDVPMGQSFVWSDNAQSDFTCVSMEIVTASRVEMMPPRESKGAVGRALGVFHSEARDEAAAL